MASGDNRIDAGDLQKLLAVILRFWKSVVLITLVVATLAVLYTFTLPFEYQATTTIFPATLIQAGDSAFNNSMIGGVSRHLGLNFLNGPYEQSILYESILKSRKFHARIIQGEFVDRDGTSQTLLDYLVPEAPTEDLRRRQALGIFAAHCLRVNFIPETGMTHVQVILQDPVMAAGVANFIADKLDEHIHEVLAEGSRSWSAFIEQRVAEAEVDLVQAEQRLKLFRDDNRVLTQSPSLMMEYGRLERDVKLKQELFISLSTQAEYARIESQKNLSKIGVLDEALVPSAKFRPRRALYLLVGLMLGFGMGVGQALVRNYFDLRPRANIE